jgi:hypothetical protein
MVNYMAVNIFSFNRLEFEHDCKMLVLSSGVVPFTSQVKVKGNYMFKMSITVSTH